MLAVTAFSSEDYKVKGLEQFGLTNDEMYSGYMPLKVFVESHFTPLSSSQLLLNLSSLLFPHLNSFLTSTFINMCVEQQLGDANDEGSYFFWLSKQRNVITKPERLVIWLNGGPGDYYPPNIKANTL